MTRSGASVKGNEMKVVCVRFCFSCTIRPRQIFLVNLSPLELPESTRGRNWVSVAVRAAHADYEAHAIVRSFHLRLPRPRQIRREDRGSNL